MREQDTAQLIFLTRQFVLANPAATFDDVLDHLEEALNRGQLNTHDEAYVKAIAARRASAGQ